MTIKEVINKAAQFNRIADALQINGDGGKRARVYLTIENDGNACDLYRINNYRDAKRLLHIIYYQGEIAARVLAFDGFKLGEFSYFVETVPNGSYPFEQDANIAVSVELV